MRAILLVCVWLLAGCGHGPVGTLPPSFVLAPEADGQAMPVAAATPVSTVRAPMLAAGRVSEPRVRSSAPQARRVETPAPPAPSPTPEPIVPEAAPTRGPVAVEGTPPRSGLWRFSWALGEGEPLEREAELTFLPDGTIESAGLLPEWKEPLGSWGDGQARFTGTCGPQWPDMRTGFSCDRYTLSIQSEVALTGTVAIQVNHRWIDVPVQGLWVGDFPAMAG